MPPSRVRTTQWPPVGTPAASMISLANAFEPSSRAGSRFAPNTRTPLTPSSSAGPPPPPSARATPATSGASGPTTTRSAPDSAAAAANATGSPGSASSRCASARMPALPGAHHSSGCWGERARARIRACSRPPAPTTRTFIGPKGRRRAGSISERRDEGVDRERRERLVVRRAARAELERDARHRLLVGRLDDIDEVEVPQRRPLGLHGRSELLDLVVDLADTRGVVADGLHTLWRERRQHDPSRHSASLKWLSGRSTRSFRPRAVLSEVEWILHA